MFEPKSAVAHRITATVPSNNSTKHCRTRERRHDTHNSRWPFPLSTLAVGLDSIACVYPKCRNQIFAVLAQEIDRIPNFELVTFNFGDCAYVKQKYEKTFASWLPSGSQWRKSEK